MIEREVRIVNELGLHARPASKIVKEASRFTADVEIVRDGMAVNGKSIMGVMMLAAECGSSIVLRATGTDESAAVDALAALVARGFDE
ncbi:MAG: HPr family phosphocarrier protein [Gemmatimonadetes bacterium]|nr:HPr family phosphocarrier protein [Gemmatimonadota bacterium]